MILCAGELMWDIHVEPGSSLETGDRLVRVPGGAAANVAMELARKGRAGGVAGVVSADALGHGLCESLENRGVDASRVSRVPGRTGLVFLERTQASSERFVSYRPTVGPFEGGISLASVRVLHIAALNPITAELQAFATLAAEARGLGAWVLVDANARPLPWRDPLDAAGRMALAELARLAHAVKVSDGDLERIGASVADPLDLFAASGTTTFLTRGGEATLVQGAWGSFERAPPAVELVRSIGAGDAFCAGILANLHDHPTTATSRGAAFWSTVLDAGHASAATRVSTAW